MSQPCGGDELTRWLELARTTVEETLESLPEYLRGHVRKLPVSYEHRPSAELIAEGIEPDSLGLFVGQVFPDGVPGSDVLPSKIVIYIANILDYVAGDMEIFCIEVETTYLHELGHFLGFDEQDLADRELD